MPEQFMLKHGGHLIQAANTYNIPLSQWIDLSTGINPQGWPVPEIPASCFSRLPEDYDALVDNAASYYGVDNLLPVAGSQAAIQLLPQLRSHCRVAVPDIGYAEHAWSWQQAGHQVDKISSQLIPEQLQLYDVLVLINPNNPSGERFSSQQLLHWHQQLQQKGGWLIVDEAFMDVSPENTLLANTNQPGLIVLRSVGKFFGLAGIRCGFVMASKPLLQQLQRALGPWTLTGPSRYIAALALADTQWQKTARGDLQQRCFQLKKLLGDTIIKHTQGALAGTELFQTLSLDNATHWHHQLALQGVLTRLLDNRQGIRFGLPADHQWNKLELVLRQLSSFNLDTDLYATDVSHT